jgi:hypothetical protein
VAACALGVALAAAAHLIANAVDLAAQERAAPLHALRHAGFAGVVAVGRPGRVARRVEVEDGTMKPGERKVLSAAAAKTARTDSQTRWPESGVNETAILSGLTEVP